MGNLQSDISIKTPNPFDIFAKKMKKVRSDDTPVSDSSMHTDTSPIVQQYTDTSPVVPQYDSNTLQQQYNELNDKYNMVVESKNVCDDININLEEKTRELNALQQTVNASNDEDKIELSLKLQEISEQKLLLDSKLIENEKLTNDLQNSEQRYNELVSAERDRSLAANIRYDELQNKYNNLNRSSNETTTMKNSIIENLQESVKRESKSSLEALNSKSATSILKNYTTNNNKITFEKLGSGNLITSRNLGGYNDGNVFGKSVLAKNLKWDDVFGVQGPTKTYDKAVVICQDGNSKPFMYSVKADPGNKFTNVAMMYNNTGKYPDNSRGEHLRFKFDGDKMQDIKIDNGKKEMFSYNGSKKTIICKLKRDLNICIAIIVCLLLFIFICMCISKKYKQTQQIGSDRYSYY